MFGFVGAILATLYHISFSHTGPFALSHTKLISSELSFIGEYTPPIYVVEKIRELAWNVFAVPVYDISTVPESIRLPYRSLSFRVNSYAPVPSATISDPERESVAALRNTPSGQTLEE